MKRIFNRQMLLKRAISFTAMACLLSGCTENREVITENDFESLELGSFAEPGFPFITTSLDARGLGPAFPDSNVAARALAITLGDSVYACFDTELLRWSAGWTGEFLPMVGMAQISYDDYFNKKNQIPTITGDPQIATGLYPGWSDRKNQFRDIRPPSPVPGGATWGPLPEEAGRWNGVYVHGDRAVLDYSVDRTGIVELPGSTRFGEEVAFTRTFQIDNPGDSLYLTVAEVLDGKRHEVDGPLAFVYHGDEQDSVTAVGITGEGASGFEAAVWENRYLTVTVSPGTQQAKATVAVWRGPAAKKDAFKEILGELEEDIPDYREGGPAKWDETVYTRGKTAPDTAAYVSDILTLPLPNPWNRNVRVADIAFFDDGRAAVVTYSGDIWIVEGIDRSLENLKWQRFASGLYEPMSIEVADDLVYVYGKEGIVRFHDLNNDGEADFYENFSNEIEQSIESREWAADLVKSPDGSFYAAKGGTLSNGPEFSPVIMKGFRAGSRHSGSVVKVSPDGKDVELFATGMRGPFLGIHPETGVLTASDQQGNFVPSTPVYLVKKGDYYGVPASAHRDDDPPITPPLTWIPHSVDQSGISQAWITGNEMGPLSGDLIHFSFGEPGLFRVLIDSTSSMPQGGVSFIPGHYPAPTSKGAVSPKDGQLYVAGFNLWGSNSKGISALLRLRYTGEPFFLPEGFRAGEQGIVLRFGVELDAETAENPNNFQVKRWNYQRTEEYGSGHFKPDGTPGEELLPVLATHLSKDRKSVLLVVPKMEKVMQMQAAYQISSASGEAMNDNFWFTLHDTGSIDVLAEGFEDVDFGILANGEQAFASLNSAEEEPVSVERGEKLARDKACLGCHSPELETAGKYGPPFKNLFGSERQFTDGTSAVADEDYIRESILEPAKRIVEGYDAEMPSFVGILGDSDIESVILYIQSLAE